MGNRNRVLIDRSHERGEDIELSEIPFHGIRDHEWPQFQHARPMVAVETHGRIMDTNCEEPKVSPAIDGSF